MITQNVKNYSNMSQTTHFKLFLICSNFHLDGLSELSVSFGCGGFQKFNSMKIKSQQKLQK